MLRRFPHGNVTSDVGRGVTAGVSLALPETLTGPIRWSIAFPGASSADGSDMTAESYEGEFSRPYHKALTIIINLQKCAQYNERETAVCVISSGIFDARRVLSAVVKSAAILDS